MGLWLFRRPQAKTVVERLLKELKSNDWHVFFLSTHITPKERKERIKWIKECLGENKKVVVVSTQLIEAGVDLDFEVVIRDFAPMDSIIQAAGRCNRNSKINFNGKLFLFKTIEEFTKKLYCKKIYSSINLEITERIISLLEEINESEYSRIIDQYYSELKKKRDTESKGKVILNLLSEWKIKEMSKNFSIIEQQDKRDVFIILDSVSRKIFEDFKESIYNKNFKESAKLRILMTNYIIQVYRKHIDEALLSKLLEDEELFYIDNLKSEEKNIIQYDDTKKSGVGFIANADIII